MRGKDLAEALVGHRIVDAQCLSMENAETLLLKFGDGCKITLRAETENVDPPATRTGLASTRKYIRGE